VRRAARMHRGGRRAEGNQVQVGSEDQHWRWSEIIFLPVLIQALLLATAGLLSVGSITLVILLLISDRGWHNGLAYALGYTGAYSLIGIAVVMLGYGASAKSSGSGEPSLLLPVTLLVLGALLLWMGLRNWRKPPVAEPEPPRFLTIVDSITPPRAFGFGALVTVLNVKNLALYLTALSVVVLSVLPLPQKVIIALLAALVFCLAVIIPVVIYLLMPGRADTVLGAFRQALDRNSRPIGIWLPLVFGLFFVVKALADLR